MRETLTVLAALLLAVLVAALAVPPFIDWSAYGSALAGRLGAIFDAQVRVDGPVVVRLLPSPRLEVGGVHVVRPGVRADTGAATLELALPSLLRGAVAVTAATVERPHITIDAPAAVSATSDATMPTAAVAIDRLTIRDGSLALRSAAGTTRRLDHLDATLSAEGIAGPFKIDGYSRLGSHVVAFHLATGELRAGQVPVTLGADTVSGTPRLDAAGTLAWGEAGPRFAGTATLAGVIVADGQGAALPWRAQARGHVDADDATADALDMRVGEDAVRLAATGSGRLSSAGLSLSLMSERPDLDRFAAAASLSRLAIAAPVLMPDLAVPVRIDWRADTAILGAEIATDLRLVLARSTDPSGRTRLTGSLRAARGAASFAGEIGTGPVAVGDLAASTTDATAFTRWLARLRPGWQAPALPFDRADIAGHLDAGPTRARLDDLRATLGRSVLTGRAGVSFPTASAAPTLDADLAASALDLDALPDLTGLPGVARGLDLRLALDAKAIRVSRIGGAPVQAGRIGLALTRRGEHVSLDRLTLDDLGGATVRATGVLSPAGAHLETTVDAKRLTDLAGLARRIAPGALTDALATRASALSPAILTAAVDADASSGALAPTRIAVSGKAGDTQVRADLAPTATGELTGALRLDAPETATFLRQLGVPVLPLRGQGVARIEATVSGRTDALAVHASAALAGTTTAFDGTARLVADAPTLAGALRIGARDLGPLLRIVAAPVDAFAGWPADLGAQIAVGADRIAANAITGSIAGVAVSGALARTAGASMSGALRLDRLDAGALGAVLLGAAPPRPAGRPFFRREVRAAAERSARRCHRSGRRPSGPGRRPCRDRREGATDGWAGRHRRSRCDDAHRRRHTVGRCDPCAVVKTRPASSLRSRCARRRLPRRLARRGSPGDSKRPVRA